MNGQFSYDPTSRTLRGILLPFGELSRTSVSGVEPILFGADSITLPRDPSVVTLNRQHNRFDPIGRATHLEKRKEGVYAEFGIADTDEGDAYLASGEFRKLSAELRDIVRDGDRAVSSTLTGAALVEEGAFASAGLFAIVAEDHSSYVSEYTDENGVTWKRTTETHSTEETVTDPADAPEEDADTTDPAAEKETALMSAANIVPDTATPAPKLTLDGLFAALSRNEPDALRQYAGMGDLFALQTLQHSGPSTVTIGADTQVPGLLGEIITRAAYQRKFVPLVKNQTLTNYSMIGWKWDDAKRPTMGDYTGNTAEVPTNALDTIPVTVTASRLAGGHRLDRRFRDFNDQTVIGSYLVNQAEDYLRQTDGKVLAAIIAAAQTTAPGSVPTGIAKGLAAIVDGALGVIATENRPAYSLVSPELWRDIILTPKDDVLAFLNAGFGLEEGDVAGFRILPANVGTGKVITGAKEAMTFWELGSTPIRVDGIQPGNGAEDIAVFGYWATNADNQNAVRVVTVA